MRTDAWWLVLLWLACGVAAADERRYAFAPAGEGDAAIAQAVAGLSRQVLADVAAGAADVPATGVAHLRIAVGDGGESVGAVEAVIRTLRESGDADRARRWAPYLLHARAGASRDPVAAYADAFRAYFADLDDLEAQRVQYWFVGDPGRARGDLRQAVSRLDAMDGIALADALELARRQAFVSTYESATAAAALIAEDERARYAIDERAMIATPDGATLSATVARSRKAVGPQPVAMQFTIYADPAANRMIAVQAAARGYVGVVVDARGKRLGRDAIAPYEREAGDARAAVDWASRQPWSDGRVVMYGGSYSGFAAWAAMKRPHPALKAIAPYAAAIPGLGLPMENNVFISANYAWPFYVANNRLLDEDIYADRERWQRLPGAWYASGRPYREIDQVDGTPNPWLQRWLAHPAYDAYWQAMVPYGDEFARIDIPVLSITGYFDDGQVSALHYFREHLRHRPDADHALVIGPYDHFGTQAPLKPRNVRGIDIDPVAQFDTQDLTFDWFDHVLHGGPRPALLRDRVNYQLVGANRWGHAPTLEAAATPVAFHLSGMHEGSYHVLAREAASTPPLVQRVDLADRTTQGHAYYPEPVLRDRLEVGGGFAFATAPFERPTSVVGAFSGTLKVRIDRRDFDFSVSLYELMADGKAVQLSYYVGRASHARDMTRRHLLEPGEWTTLPFERTRMTARRMAAGSRLVAVVDVLRNENHQVNHGTGRDVSDESVADAGGPMTIEWHPDSVLSLPLREDLAE